MSNLDLPNLCWKFFKHLVFDYKKVVNHAFLSCCWEANKMKSCLSLTLASNTTLTLILHWWNKSLLNLIEFTTSSLKISAWLDLLKEQIILLMFCTLNNWQYPRLGRINNVKIINPIVQCIFIIKHYHNLAQPYQSEAWLGFVWLLLKIKPPINQK